VAKRKKKSLQLIFRNKITAVLIAGILIAAGMLICSLFVLMKRQIPVTAAAVPYDQLVSGAAVPQTGQQPAAPEPEAVVIPTLQPPETQPAVPEPAIASQPERPQEKSSAWNLVFIIDDVGYNLRELEPFLEFPGPLTMAVLPGLPDSAEAARRIRAAGKELILHQPMESLGGLNPGPGAVYTGMDEAEIRSIINRNLDEIWPVVGMNNHEGSKVSMDEKIMEIVLDICRQRGIIFIDSRTTADTAAPEAAKKLGMQIGERDVFLDNEQNRDSIIAYLNTGLDKAAQKGRAVMIGHVTTADLAPILDEFYPGMIDRGYTLSDVSGLINAR